MPETEIDPDAKPRHANGAVTKPASAALSAKS
jgi:hypothetical protein